MLGPRPLCFILLLSATAGIALSQQLNKNLVFPDNVGGLYNYADLGPVLPMQHFTLTPNTTAQASDCNYPGYSNECEKAGTYFTQPYNAVYDDATSHTVLVCACANAPFSISQLAATFGQVRALQETHAGHVTQPG